VDAGERSERTFKLVHLNSINAGQADRFRRAVGQERICCLQKEQLPVHETCGSKRGRHRLQARDDEVRQKEKAKIAVTAKMRLLATEHK
jgi:hypothetical protein